MNPIEKCPACFGGKGTAFGGARRSCNRCKGSGQRRLIDRIDPTGQDVFVLYGVGPGQVGQK